MIEIWKPIKGYERFYEVSNLGRVKSKLGKKIRFLKSNCLLKGYRYSQLQSKNFLTHRLVAQAFIPNPENKPQVNHKDGVKDNNFVENLEWVTQSENEIHARKTGLKRTFYGEDVANSKLTLNQVLEIKKSNKTQIILSKEYGVHQVHIGRIKSGKRWGHLKNES